ncbi:hypothetical protein ACF1BE_18760 [Streptomyces sp. NPDC014991]|uniref:hypothetical protein n=1 Tax=Streptomyces sp. NPDC014991 TaxID=3364935 RepID=UPI0036F6449F
MDTLWWIPFSIILLGVASAVWGLFDRPMMSRAGALLCVLGVAIFVGLDIRSHSFKWLIIDILLLVWNVLVARKAFQESA